jgi:hypothetical protein
MQGINDQRFSKWNETMQPEGRGHMARKGDGIFKRGRVWLLDSAAIELAVIQSAPILKGEAGKISAVFRSASPSRSASGFR